MFTQNLHAHGQFDDGRSTLEEMLLASRKAGLTSIGFSIHCPMPCGGTSACPQSRIGEYLETVAALREKYAGRMEVFCGIEWDTVAQALDLSPYDYAIGSAHLIPRPMKIDPACPPALAARFAVDYPVVDESPEATARCIAGHFGGDADAMAQAYFAQTKLVAAQPKAMIVGHFDLLTKFDEARPFFAPMTPAYKKAALDAMETLVGAGKVFEVNTGAIARGMRSTPYPSRELLGALHEMGGRVTISSDSHHASTVTCAFELAEKIIRKSGFTEIARLARVNGKAQFISERI